MNMEPPKTILGNRVNYCSVSVREFLVIYGGYNFRTNTNCHDLWSYNTMSCVWKRHPTPIELEDVRRHTKICAYENKVYLCSIKYPARDTIEINSLFSFEVINSKWETLYSYSVHGNDNRPHSISVCLFFYHHESLYLMGNGEIYPDIDVIYNFCLKTYTWSVVEQIGVTPVFKGILYGAVFKNMCNVKLN
ncbi:hypothetical protein RF11_04003 [Thelohanellus kitauei]|uniref:Kelch domain-containing protein 10 n=1 Tax=Thelohanellus kitauei TaxID=669202 RepID=A0A0C2MPS6_THEKT|nr:hypothetical protein RF11_04003 [Thelohanellus kitauei]